jgi:hypothetical protein
MYSGASNLIDRDRYMESKKRPYAYPLRLPDELKEWVKDRACFNRRSFNTEVNVMIEIAREVIEKKKQVEAQVLKT